MRVIRGFVVGLAVLLAASCDSDSSPPRPSDGSATAKPRTLTVEDAVFVLNPADNTATLSAKVVNRTKNSYSLSYVPSVEVPGDENSDTIVRYFSPRTVFAPGTPQTLGDEAEGTQIRLFPAPKVGTTVKLQLGFDLSDESSSLAPVDLSLEVPVVDRTIDHLSVLGAKPNKKITVEDGTIVVVPGQERAMVDGRIVSSVTDNAYELPGASDEQGNRVEYRHHTATGGPYAIHAEKGKSVRIASAPPLIPDDELMGDYDYFDAKDVTIGEKILVRIPFQSGDVYATFTVVRG